MSPDDRELLRELSKFRLGPPPNPNEPPQ